MTSEWETGDCDDFIREARACGCAAVVLAWRREYGQVPDQPTVDYRQLRLIWLIAYDRGAGRVLRCRIADVDADRAVLRKRLEIAGFSVKERSRNAVGWN